MTDGNPQTGEWLTLAEAAQKLGVSVDTVRRRLHRGELISKQELTRFGKAWMVQVEDVPSAGQSPRQELPTPTQQAPNSENEVPSAEQRSVHSPGHGVDGQGMIELVQLIKELQLKAETAAMWQARAMVLEEQLDHTRLQLRQAYETVKAIEAPKEPESEIKEEPPSEHESWWRTWWQKFTTDSD